MKSIINTSSEETPFVRVAQSMRTGSARVAPSRGWIKRIRTRQVSAIKLTAVPKEMPKVALRRQALRDRLWPQECSELWHRTTEDGYSTIPRTLPLIMTLIDDLKGKGRDISRVYFDLWCRQIDDSFVEVNDEESFAYSSGS